MAEKIYAVVYVPEWGGTYEYEAREPVRIGDHVEVPNPNTVSGIVRAVRETPEYHGVHSEIQSVRHG